MDELPKRVLYAFYPDRFLTMEQAVERSRTSLPFVRNTINKLLVADGYVEEIVVPKAGQKHNYFHLTQKGKIAAAQVHTEREWLRKRIDQLRAEGLDLAQAAVRAAVESIKTDKLTS